MSGSDDGCAALDLRTSYPSRIPDEGSQEDEKAWESAALAAKALAPQILRVESELKQEKREKDRANLLGMRDKASRVAAYIGHECPECGVRGVWRESANLCDPETGEVLTTRVTGPDGTTRDVPVTLGATVCPKCGKGLSRSQAPRTAACGKIAREGNVTLHATARVPGGGVRARIEGLRRCNAPWRCPFCASIQQAKDRETLHAANLGFRSDPAHEGGEVYMLTLTVPHHAGDELAPMRKAITAAYTDAHEGRKIRDLREEHDILASLRRLEVTHGPNSWHPHIHAMLWTSRPWPEDEQQALREWYVEHFGAAVEDHKMERPDLSCVDISVADSSGRYFAKMGLMEIAGDIGKQARCGACRSYAHWQWRDGRRCCVNCGGEVNRTPFQILGDLTEHDEMRDWDLWCQYYREIFGTRRLTWSRWKTGLDLRTAYPVGTLAPGEQGRLPTGEADTGVPDFRVPAKAFLALPLSERQRLHAAYERRDVATLEAFAKSLEADTLGVWSPADPPAMTRELALSLETGLLPSERLELVDAERD